LNDFTKELLRKKGDKRLNTFLATGYEKHHLLEVFTKFAVKFIYFNFSNGLANARIGDVLKLKIKCEHTHLNT